MITNTDLTYIIPLVAILVSFIFFLLFGKRVKNKSKLNWTKYIPLLSVVIFLGGVFYISEYYEKQLNIEKEKLKSLERKININDSIYLSNESKLQAIDSLNLLKSELNALLSRVEKQEKVTGKNSDISEKISEKISYANSEIGTIKSYNEIIKPEKKLKGYTTSGNTSNFIFNCPKDLSKDYLDLKLRFQDEKLVSKIAYIMIDVTEIRKNGENWQVFGQTYKPQYGVNAFKIKNYLKKDSTKIEIGYFLKSELNKEYPTFEKVTCK